MLLIIIFLFCNSVVKLFIFPVILERRNSLLFCTKKKQNRIATLFKINAEKFYFSALKWVLKSWTFQHLFRKVILFNIFLILTIYWQNTWKFDITFHSVCVFWNCKKCCMELVAKLDFFSTLRIYPTRWTSLDKCTTRAEKILFLQLAA